MHFLQSLLKRLVPWYFEGKPLSAEEKELVYSLTLKTSTDYEKIIEKIAEQYDFRGIQIEKMFANFETRAKRKQLSKVRTDISYKKSDINNLGTNYLKMLDDLEKLYIQENGLIYQIDNCDPKDSEIADFFKCNKHLYPVSVDDNYIKIIVDTYISNYDPLLYERMLKNEKSFFYEGYTVSEPVFYEKQSRKKFLEAALGEDAVFKIKVCAYYCLDLRGSVSSSTTYTYPENYKHFLVNPHIKIHSCIGNNRPHIDKFLRDGDYIVWFQ